MMLENLESVGLGEPQRLGSCWIFGQAMGGIVDGVALDSGTYLAQLAQNPTDELVASGVGSFTLVAESQQAWNIRCSVGSPGLWYRPGSPHRIWGEESQALGYASGANRVNGDEVWDVINSHHLLSRTPFSTLNPDVKRLPPGFSIILGDKEHIDSATPQPIFSARRLNRTDTDSNLAEVLGQTLQIYKDHDENLGLLFSGGLDSSVLLSIAADCGVQFSSLTHRLYGKAPRQLGPIAERFGYLPKLAEQPQPPLNLEEFCVRASVGFGTVLAPNYLPFDVYAANYEKRETMVSGQNADTLYALDHFSPGTETVGLRRVVAMLKSLPKRSLYTRQFLAQNPERRAKLAQVLGGAEGNPSRFSNIELFRSLWSGNVEHSIPFYGTSLESFSTTNQRWANDLELARKSLSGLGDWDDLHEMHMYTVLRTLRWLRTVHNTHANYSNRQFVTGTQTLTPFSEGPILSLLLSLELGLVDAVNPKSAEKKIYRRNAGISFRAHVRRSQSAKILRAKQPTQIGLGKELLVQLHQLVQTSYPLSQFDEVDQRVETVLRMNSTTFRENLLTRTESMRMCRLLNWRLVRLASVGAIARHNTTYTIQSSAQRATEEGRT